MMVWLKCQKRQQELSWYVVWTMQNAIGPAFCLPSKRKLHVTFFHGLETYKFASKNIKILKEFLFLLVGVSSLFMEVHIQLHIKSSPLCYPIKIFTIGFYGLTDSYSLIKQGWIIKIEVYKELLHLLRQWCWLLCVYKNTSIRYQFAMHLTLN